MSNFKFISTISAVVLALSYGSIAQAATVTTTGTWSNVTPPGVASGVGTNQISWGTPATSSGQSSYVFDGVTGESITLPAPGGTSNVFELGTFTHNNFPITGTFLTGATLNLTLDIVNGGTESQTFSFNFAHNETTNVQPPSGPACTTPPGSVEPCPDIVSFLNNGVSNETITINGEEYNLIINGFLENGSLVDEFITLEGQANSATLFGFLGKPADAVPEPFTILGVGTALGFGATFKKQLSKKKK